MAVTAFNVVSTSGGIDHDGHSTLRAVWQCRTNDTLDQAWTVLTHAVANLPAYWTGMDNATNANCFIQSIGDASLQEEQGSRRVWLVPVTYSTKPAGGDGTSSRPLSPFTTPIVEPWRISGTFVRDEKATRTDKDGNLITTLGTLEPREVRIPSGFDTLHLEGATANISMSTRASAIWHVNSATIWGLQPRQLLMTGWSYDIRRHGTTGYVYHSLDFWISTEPGGFDESFHNLSFKKLNTAWALGLAEEEKLLPICDTAGMPVHEPHPIDENGDSCAPGDEPVITPEAIPEFDFTTLGFPDPLPGPFV